MHSDRLGQGETCVGRNQVSIHVQACFEAIDKGFLQKLVVVIYESADHPEVNFLHANFNDDDASQKVLESYSFKFAYSGITVERFDCL